MKIKGVIKDIDNQGTIVYVIVTDKKGHDHRIPMHHRMFQRMIEDKDPLIGKQVMHDDDVDVEAFTFDEGIVKQ